MFFAVEQMKWGYLEHSKTFCHIHATCFLQIKYSSLCEGVSLLFPFFCFYQIARNICVYIYVYIYTLIRCQVFLPLVPLLTKECHRRRRNKCEQPTSRPVPSSNPVPATEQTGRRLLLPCHLPPSLCFRARHYIHIPVHFKPKSAGKFKGLLVIQTDEGRSIAVQLFGEALGKD